MSIETNLAAILAAKYGRDVRQSIHDGIQECYSDVSAAKTLADDSVDIAASAAAGAAQALIDGQAAVDDAELAIGTANDNVINSVAFTDGDMVFTKANSSTISIEGAEETLKGASAVYVGEEAPTDPDILVWIDEDADPEYLTAYESAVENGYTKTKEQFYADLEGLEDAITDAIDATGLANNAAGLANNAAELANTKAGLADTATGLANTAKDGANSAKDLANSAASNADIKAGLANDAATLANTKAGLANDAADLANTKAGLADTAAINADTATGIAIASSESNGSFIKDSKNPLTFYPSPSSALHWRAEGTFEQEAGIPTPEEPKAITPWLGEGDVVLENRGKNIFNDTFEGGYYNSSGTKVPGANNVRTFGITLHPPGVPVMISVDTAALLNKIAICYYIDGVFQRRVEYASTKNYRLSEPLATENGIAFHVASGGEFLVSSINTFQIEYSSVATPYEPYTPPQTATITVPEIAAGWIGNDGKGEKTWGYIASYVDEVVPAGWKSSTGALTVGAQVVYPLVTPEPITFTPAPLSTLPALSDLTQERANYFSSTINGILTYPKNKTRENRILRDGQLWRRVTGNPASIYPTPESNLYVRASGEPIQEGTGDPSPGNIRPILPWKASGEMAKVKRTGKNLITFSEQCYGGGYNGGIACVLNYNAPVFPIVTTSQTSGIVFLVRCYAGTVYTLSITNPVLYTNIMVAEYPDLPPTGRTTTGFLQNISSAGAGTKSITAIGNGYLLVNLASIYDSANPGNRITITGNEQIQLELGSTATPYEPYSGEEITLTAPQEIAAGWMDNERKGQGTWAKKVFDGTENITSSGPNGQYGYFLVPKMTVGTNQQFYCSHYKVGGLGPYPEHTIIFGLDNNAIYFCPNGSAGVCDVPALKAYLASEYAAGHPVQIVYQLATPVSITPAIAPLTALTQLDRTVPRLNVVATDAQGLRTDYAKSPIQESNEQNAAIVATGV